MARKRGGLNLSEEIRKYAATHTNEKPKAMAAGLAAAGIKTTPLYVSTVLSNQRRKGGKKSKRGAKRGRATKTVLANLVLANKLAEKMGGIDAARAALDALAKVLG